MPSCVICLESNNQLVKIKHKGIASLIEYSKLRDDHVVTERLQESNEHYVHENCRKWYNNKRRINSNNDSTEIKKSKNETRLSSTVLFNWKTHCFFCKEATDDRKTWHCAQTFQIKDTILGICDKRIGGESPNDGWALEVKGRISNCADFVAAEARYHQDCRVRFSTEGKTLSADGLAGRPRDTGIIDAFEEACYWVETDCELHSIPEFVLKMKEIAKKEVYSNKYVTKLLKDKYGDHVLITNTGHGKENIITFKDNAKYLIKEKYKFQQENIEDETSRLIHTVADLIKSEIRDKPVSDMYPSHFQLSDVTTLQDWITPTLYKLLEILIPSSLKQIAIGHSIIQACRTRVISPLIFGLGVELDNAFSSKWLNDHLSRFGFSVTSDEIRRFKQSIMEQETPLPEIPNGSFVQWSADNVDHNSVTLDGKGTFHGMGILTAITPAIPMDKFKAIRRLSKRNQVCELVKNKGIPIMEYSGSSKPPSILKFKPYTVLEAAKIVDNDFYYELLWLSSRNVSKIQAQHPNWSGFMQEVFSPNNVYPQNTENYSHSSLIMLPLIDMNPSDLTCIYSTLKFIESQASHLGVVTPCVTFDQPLWYKANTIIHEKELNMICRLGGFHLLMSFLGSIGSMMSGSGIEEALSEIYAPNVVPHIKTGKAYSRALRGHFLISLSLHQLLIDEAVESELISKDDMQLIGSYYDSILDPSISITPCEDALENLGIALETLKSRIQSSRTATYWLQYIKYIDVVKRYIRAERTGNWELHLSSISEMLNLFAATNHLHYAKSSRYYLQQMLELPNTHPEIYLNFIQKGYHAIRRTDRYWAGLWSDLIIEQVMMRSIKGRGGLTRGRGFSESVRHQWIYTAHECAGIHDLMTNLTHLKLTSSEQHVEMGRSRQCRDSNDAHKLYNWFKIRNPFQSEDSRLRSLSSGIVVEDDSLVNCDKTEVIGRQIHTGLDQVELSKAKIKRSDAIKNLDSLYNTVTVGKRQVSINPNLLFNRLTAVAGREDDVEKYFDFELTTYPLSLFQDGLMRKPDKACLRNVLLTANEDRVLTKYRVIDGGALLHRIHWPKSCTYLELYKHHVQSVRKLYGQCTVVFDGYEGSSTKDHEHKRRSSKVSALEVKLNDESTAHHKREEFLSSSKNKTQLIAMLNRHLLKDRQAVVKCKSDADTQIVKEALKLAEHGDVEVISDDTDVAILLLYHWKEELCDIKFTSERSNRTWSISKSVAQLSPEIKDLLLVIHAFSGCDTVSAIFGKGKPTLLKQMKASSVLREHAGVVGDICANASDVGQSGIEIFLRLFGAKKKDTLQSLRYAKFQDMAANGQIDPQKLPPTENAAYYHSLRSHLQIMVWETLDDDEFDPLEWGWSAEDGLQPVKIDKPVAPSELLDFIRCQCKSGCTSKLCSCRKHGLVCVTACKNCRGDCKNAEVLDEEAESDIDDGGDRNIFDV